MGQPKKPKLCEKTTGFSHGGRFPGFFIITFMLVIPYGYADPKVYSPHVKSGVLAFENRGNVTFDNDGDKGGSQRHVFELEYGINDWWKTAAVARLDKSANGSLRYDSMAWENIFQLTEQEKYWLDAGIYLEYQLKDDSNTPDIFEGKLLVEKKIQGYQHTLNLTIEQELGSKGDDDLEFEYAWRTRKKLTDELMFGIEAFGKLGELRSIKDTQDQDHRAGPVVYHEFHLGDLEVEYKLAWLFGLTSATPDHTFRWQIEVPFN